MPIINRRNLKSNPRIIFVATSLMGSYLQLNKKIRKFHVFVCVHAFVYVCMRC